MERTKKISIEEGIELFDKIEKLFKQNDKIDNFDDWRQFDDEIKQLEEAKDDFSFSQTDFQKRKEDNLKNVEKIRTKLGLFFFFFLLFLFSFFKKKLLSNFAKNIVS